MLQLNKDGKITVLSMIREYFFENAKANEVMAETLKLSEQDKLELGSALSRHYNVPDAQLTFTPIAY